MRLLQLAPRGYSGLQPRKCFLDCRVLGPFGEIGNLVRVSDPGLLEVPDSVLAGEPATAEVGRFL